jgi:hypothetical protein
MIVNKILTRASIGCRNRKIIRNLSLTASQNKNRKFPPQVSENKKAMKYILVTGGVISGVGKGVIASSFGTLLNCCGISVTSLKIDPYINIDAGTFSPYEHVSENPEHGRNWAR